MVLEERSKTRRLYLSNKGEATWDIPISSLPTVEDKEVWNRHPTLVSLQRSRDGWAWYTANVGRLLPSHQDIEVEEGGPHSIYRCGVPLICTTASD